MKVFVVEDNIKLANNIVKYLKIKWINSETDYDGPRAYQKARDEYFDVIILDINLPGMDWLEICEKLRNNGIITPILLLTSRNTTSDVIKGLNYWADDYLWKPFEYWELLARIESLYRRNSVKKNSIIKIKNIEININKRIVSKNDKNIEMSKLEFDLLKYLIQNQWNPIDRKELLEKVWGDFEDYMFSRTVDVYVWYLRKKLWTDFVKTVKWFGYVIE